MGVCLLLPSKGSLLRFSGGCLDKDNVVFAYIAYLPCVYFSIRLGLFVLKSSKALLSPLVGNVYQTQKYVLVGMDGFTVPSDGADPRLISSMLMSSVVHTLHNCFSRYMPFILWHHSSMYTISLFDER